MFKYLFVMIIIIKIKVFEYFTWLLIFLVHFRITNEVHHNKLIVTNIAICFSNPKQIIGY